MIVRVIKSRTEPFEAPLSSIDEEAEVMLDRDAGSYEWFKGHDPNNCRFGPADGPCQCRRFVLELHVKPRSQTTSPRELWLTDGCGRLLFWNGERWLTEEQLPRCPVCGAPSCWSRHQGQTCDTWWRPFDPRLPDRGL